MSDEPGSGGGAAAPAWQRWFPWAGTLGLGLFVALRTDLSSISSAVLDASPAWLGLAVALYLADRALAAGKWRLLFNADGSQRLGITRALSIYLRAGFLGSVLPSTVGMDAIRVGLARREAGGPLPHAVGSVVVERWLGVIGLVVVAAFGLFIWGPRGRWMGIGGALLGLGTAALLVSLLLLAPGLRVERDGEGGWMARALGFLSELQRSLRSYSERPGILVAVFALAVGQQYLVVLINWILAIALGIALPITLFLWLWPLVLIAIRLPVSVLGFGIRETMLYGYFVSGGLPAGDAVTLGLLSGGLDLLIVGVGGLVMLRRPDSARAAVAASEPSP